MSAPCRWFELSRLPAATVAQAILGLSLVGIVLSIWVEAPEETDPWRAVAMAEATPLVAQLQGKQLRVTDLDSGRTLFLGDILTERAPSSFAERRFWDWPAEWSLPRVFSTSTWTNPRAIFLFDDECLWITQQRGDNYANWLVHLPSQKTHSWICNDPSRRGNLALTRLDGWVLGLGPKAGMGRSDTFWANAQSGYIDPNVALEVVVAIDLETGSRQISEEQKRRAVAEYVNPKSAGIVPQILEATLASHDLGNQQEGIVIEPVEISASGEWDLNEREKIMRFTTSFDGGMTTSMNRYWKLNEEQEKAEQVSWPFRQDETFEECTPIIDHPLVIGIKRTPKPGSVDLNEQNVLWNLQTGAVTNLPGYVSDFRQFDNRLLLSIDSSCYWLDLSANRIDKITSANDWTVGQAGGYEFLSAKVLIVVGWLAAWLWLIRPTEPGDRSRRFGVFFLLSAVGALSVPKLDILGIYLYWPMADWLCSAAFLLPVLGLVLAGLLWRCVSGFLLCTASATGGILFFSLLCAGDTPVFDPLAPTRLTTWSSTTPMKKSLWLNLTDPNAAWFAPFDPVLTSKQEAENDPNFVVTFVGAAQSKP